jgi:hypothetical protein
LGNAIYIITEVIRIDIWLKVCMLVHMDFEWDENKNKENISKHAVSFFDAQHAFFDKKRVIAIDTKHTTKVEKNISALD